MLKKIVFLVFLTIFNWFFEILKWQELVSSIKKISFKNAIEQCLGSLTVSLFTPNRIGEYGAKAIYFTSSFRKRIVLLNLLNNLLQMGVTSVFGIIGLFYFAQSHTNTTIIKPILYLFIYLSLFTLIILVARKTNITIRGYSLNKMKHFLFHFPKKKIVFSSTYSLARYMIFSFQFYYVLTLFGIDITYLNTMKVISSMYLLASIIPSIFIFDVVIKGSIAVYLFSLIGVNELVVLCVITIMWILNFVFPSIIGSYYVLHFNFPKEDELS